MLVFKDTEDDKIRISNEYLYALSQIIYSIHSVLNMNVWIYMYMNVDIHHFRVRYDLLAFTFGNQTKEDKSIENPTLLLEDRG